MDIVQNNFINLLSGVKQYQIPIYQRNYGWTTENCQRLLEDIVKCGADGAPNHYIGSIIVKKEESIGYEIFNVIDGQQRMTTISLLLLALCKYWQDNPSLTVDPTTAAILCNIKDLYIVNDSLKSISLYSKLLPKNGSDRTEYENLLIGANVGTGTIIRNYKYFVDALNTGAYSVVDIYQGIYKAQLASVTLVKDENPQLLFEAINDTGIDLTDVDLIRNWIFMGLSSKDQEKLYRSYWIPIETLLADKLEKFLRYFIILKSEIKNPEVYKTFKKTFILAAGNANSIENILIEMKDYSEIYNNYVNNSYSDRKLKTSLFNLNKTGKDVFIPLILRILKMKETGVITSDDAVEMLTYLESYIVRRDMLEIPTNSLPDAHILLLKNCSSLNSFINELSAFTETKRMPTDADLGLKLQTQDFYHLSDAYYYLERIEKKCNSAFALTDPTIEHILPETMHTTANPKPRVSNPLDYNWELDLGTKAIETHDKYQHTLGNLTILPREENSRMGDLRFQLKQTWKSTTPGSLDYGYNYTSIRISQSLKNYSIWNEQSILSRCKEMVGYIIQIWPHP